MTSKFGTQKCASADEEEQVTATLAPADKELAECRAKIMKLEERVAFLSRGQEVVAKAEEYAKLFAEYEAQVARLTLAVEKEREYRRVLVQNLEAKYKAAVGEDFDPPPPPLAVVNGNGAGNGT